MEFIQELRKENRQLTTQLQETEEKFRRLMLEDSQNSKVFFLVYTYQNSF